MVHPTLLYGAAVPGTVMKVTKKHYCTSDDAYVCFMMYHLSNLSDTTGDIVDITGKQQQLSALGKAAI